MTNSQKRIVILDVFRAFSALAVLIFHFDRTHFHFGKWGVQFFFTISGFVIFKSLENAKNTFEFLIKRFFRLYPTYWICLILTTIMVNIFPNNAFPTVDLRQFLFNLTMIQEMLGIENIDGSYWSLQPELLFYLFIALVFQFKWENRIVYIGLIWLLIILLNYIFVIEKHFIAIKLLNIRHGGLFFSGILFYQIYKGSASKIIYLALGLSYCISLLIYARLFDFWGALSILSLIYALFALFLNNRLSFLAHPYLLFIGSISYPLYLIHQSIGLILLSRINAYFPFFISFLIVLILLIIVAYLIHILIEKPSQKLFK